jgi:S1-C subfamily serine protease
VLFFHTGVHEDYHRSTDTWDRINADGLARVVVMAERVIGTLARAPAPSYVEVVTDRPETAVGGTYPGGGTAFLGVAARLGDDAPGVPLSLVQPGTAAARAGLQAGDVIVRVGGLRVYSFDELHESIVARQPGDSVDVVYLRDGETRQVSAVLGGRP